MSAKYSYKFKQFYFLVIKLAIIFGASYFIYQKLMHNEALSWVSFKALLQRYKILEFKTLFYLMLFTLLNWFLEIIKWQQLVNILKSISFKQAMLQSLSSHTASIITPNKIGEYGAKALYFKTGKRQIMLLTFLGNFLQLAATLFFGVFGVIYLFLNFDIAIPYRRIGRLLVYGSVFIIGLFRISKHKKAYLFGFSSDKFKQALRQVPKTIIWKTYALAILKYIVFSSQFYFLLQLFQVDLNLFQAYIMLSSMYFISAMLPMFSLFDFVIKGAVAVWLFEKAGISPEIILSITTIMWLFNFVFPAILGSFGVLNYSKSQQI
jgi:uncharacterized membrane protein YbhN (UPF0104 family)